MTMFVMLCCSLIFGVKRHHDAQKNAIARSYLDLRIAHLWRYLKYRQAGADPIVVAVKKLDYYLMILNVSDVSSEFLEDFGPVGDLLEAQHGLYKGPESQDDIYALALKKIRE